MLTLVGEYREQGCRSAFKTKLADSFVGVLQSSLLREGFVLTAINDLPDWEFEIVTDLKTVTIKKSFCVNDVLSKLRK